MLKGVSQSLRVPTNALSLRPTPAAQLPPLPLWLRDHHYSSQTQQKLSIPKVHLFKLRYCRDNVPSFFHRAVMDDPLTRVRFLTTKHRYVNDPPPAGLWWQVTANMLAVDDKPTKAIVRGRARRRVKQAFIEALRNKGYDQQGRWKGDKDKDNGRTPHMLKGTMTMFLYKGAPLHADWTQLLQQTGLVVQWLMKDSMNTETRHRDSMSSRQKFTSSSANAGHGPGKAMTNRIQAITN